MREPQCCSGGVTVFQSKKSPGGGPWRRGHVTPGAPGPMSTTARGEEGGGGHRVTMRERPCRSAGCSHASATRQKKPRRKAGAKDSLVSAARGRGGMVGGHKPQCASRHAVPAPRWNLVRGRAPPLPSAHGREAW